jgi:hypothetical protein
MQYDALLEMFGQKVKFQNFHKSLSFLTKLNFFPGGRIRRTKTRPRRSQVNFAHSKDANQRVDAKAQRHEVGDLKVVQLVH